MAMPTYDRSPWVLEPDVSFLDHAAHGACPAPVLEAQRVWRSRMEAEPVRFLDRDLERRLDEVRFELGRFLGADPEGLAFVAGGAAALATVLASRRFAAGDELLASDHEADATLDALREVAQRDGAVLRIARIPFPVGEPSQVVEAYLEAVGPHTRFAMVSHVTGPTAIVLPVDAIVRELDRRGVDVFVDAALAPGMVEIDLGRLAAPYWTANTHTWLCGPRGVAILHLRADRRTQVRPLSTMTPGSSGPAGRSRYRQEFDHAGTWDVSAVLSLPAALRYVGGLDDAGWPGLVAANRSLARQARDLLCRALDVAPPVPDAMLGSMAAVPLPGLAPTADAAERLQAELFDEERIEVPIRVFPGPAALEGATPRLALVRVSAQRYNRLDEYARLADSLAGHLRGRSRPRSLLGRLRRG